MKDANISFQATIGILFLTHMELTMVNSRFWISLAVSCFLVFVIPGVVNAQKYPLELSRSQMQNSNLKSGVGSIEVEQDHASLILPILPLESFMLLVYLKEDQTTVTTNGFPMNLNLGNGSETYAVTDFPEKLINSTRGVLLAIPVRDSTWVFRRDEILATDYKDVDSQDRSFMNQFLYRPKTAAKGKWLYGISHLGGIAQDAFIPLLGYTYNGDVVRINSVLPSYFILQLKLGDHAYVLIDETITAESYRLTEASPWNGAYVSFLNLTSRLEAGIRFGDFEIGLSYGLVNFRTWKLSDRDHHELQNWELDAAAVTSLQIQWNL
ncbi:MAG: hypothetical protein ABIK68_22860 [bacterium]